jgi:hypothetical protein
LFELGTLSLVALASPTPFSFVGKQLILRAFCLDLFFAVVGGVPRAVSAYATVGLSLGVPYDNYSLSGSFRKLSKLVVVVVMIRGRHRGLPVAVSPGFLLGGNLAITGTPFGRADVGRC